jgi:hypothetical protein
MKGILIDETGDIAIKSGTMVIGDCDQDIAERLIKSWKGEFKENPMLGGNIYNMQNGKPDPFWRGDVMSQLRKEHINVKRLEITDSEIELEII